MAGADRFKARPTVYKGVKMRSRLEAGFAAWLDDRRFEWAYEPGAFAGERGQYLPDFRIESLRCSWLEEPATAYVEVKPKAWPYWDERDDADQEHEALMRRMAIIWESEPAAVLLLAQPRGTDGTNEVGVLDIRWSPSNTDPYPWPVEAILVMTSNDRQLGLAISVRPPQGPWPDGYWKGR